MSQSISSSSRMITSSTDHASQSSNSNKRPSEDQSSGSVQKKALRVDGQRGNIPSTQAPSEKTIQPNRQESPENPNPVTNVPQAPRASSESAIENQSLIMRTFNVMRVVPGWLANRLLPNFRDTPAIPIQELVSPPGQSLLNRALEAFNAKNWNVAENLYNQAIEELSQDEISERTWYQLGQTKEFLKKFEEARECYLKCIGNDMNASNDVWAGLASVELSLGNEEPAEEYMKKAGRLYEYYMGAFLRIDKLDHVKAREPLNELLKLPMSEKDRELAYELSAGNYCDLQEFEKADAEALKALEINCDGSRASLLQLRGEIKLKQKDLPAAKELLLRALKAYEDNNESVDNALWHFLGKVEASLGALDQAEEYYNKAGATKDAFLAGFLEEISKQNYQKAKNYSDRLLELASDVKTAAHAFYYQCSAVSKLRLGDLEGAEADANHCVEMQNVLNIPTSSLLLIYLGEIKYHQKDFSQAKVYFNQALDAPDSNPDRQMMVMEFDVKMARDSKDWQLALDNSTKLLAAFDQNNIEIEQWVVDVQKQAEQELIRQRVGAVSNMHIPSSSSPRGGCDEAFRKFVELVR